jgi:hypothetical protein
MPVISRSDPVVESDHRDLLPASRGARRFRDLVTAFGRELGGLDQLSEIKLSLLRRLAAVVVQSETLEPRMINGEAVAVADLCKLASTAMRLTARLGVKQVAHHRRARVDP